MKKVTLTAVILALVTGLSFSQFKEIPKETKERLKGSSSKSGLILGFINPKNFSLNHSFNMSYQTGGNTSMSLASYTASMNYKILNNMNLSADVTMQYSPYASIGSNNPAINKDFQNSLTGLNLSRVSLDYSPFKDMHISVNYINLKGSPYLYDPYYTNNNYNNPFWNNRY